jgi:hypothetical protein
MLAGYVSADNFDLQKIEKTVNDPRTQLVAVNKLNTPLARNAKHTKVIGQILHVKKNEGPVATFTKGKGAKAASYTRAVDQHYNRMIVCW